MTSSERLSTPAAREAPVAGARLLAPHVLTGLRHPRRLIARVTAALGDVSAIRLGRNKQVLVFAHPDHAQHILLDRQRDYLKESYGYRVSRRLFGNGLLTSEGAFWLRQRRLAQPVFTRAGIGSFAEVMGKQAMRTVEELRRRTSDAPVDMLHHAHLTTIRIVTESLFGTDLGDRLGAIEEAFGLLAADMSDRIYRPLLLVFGGARRARRVRDARAVIDRTIDEIIAKRRAQPADDIVGRYVAARDPETGEGMSDEQLKDEIFTLFIAGEETIANALAWTFVLLAENPAVAAELRAELAFLEGRAPRLDEVERLPLTRSVLEESMRLYPPVWIIGRTARVDDEIGGFRVKRGTDILIAVERIQRDPRFWSNPDSFDPRRFAPDLRKTHHKWAYLPFIAGPHQCIGNHFALLEGVVILATLLGNYALRLPRGHRVSRDAGLTMRPRGGLPMKIAAIR